MTTTDGHIYASNTAWARVELTRMNRADNNTKYRVVVEGCPQLRAFLRKTVVVGRTTFFADETGLHKIQHRAHGFLTQQGGTVFFPVYKLLELMDAAGYALVMANGHAGVETYIYKRTA